MNIESFPFDRVPAALRAQSLALQEQAWPAEALGAETPGHDPSSSPVSVLLLEDGRVLASLDILSKQIDHAGERYRVSGLSAVVTDSARRGKGYGHRLVTEARAMIARGGADLGLFTCDRPLAGFYERAGWTVLPGTALIGGTREEPFPSDRFDKVTLAAFFTAHARRHAERFENARIALYPGNIDRLW